MRIQGQKNNLVMNQKQKDQLRTLLKARKRAEKVLAARHEAEEKKQQYQQRKAANQELIRQYTQELDALAQESGILTLAEQAAAERGGMLEHKVSFYKDYGMASSRMQHYVTSPDHGELRVSHLAIRVIWGEPGALKEAEVRIHRKGLITFHNFVLPVLPLVWRRRPGLLLTLLNRALDHPRQHQEQ